MAATGLARTRAARPAGSDAGVSIVSASDIAPIAADWAALAARPQSDNLFFHPEFAHSGDPAISVATDVAVALVRSPSRAL